MLIQHRHEDSKGVFFISGEAEEILAEITYSIQVDGNILIEHTEVDDELRGQNIGLQLVQAVVDYARSQKLKLIPLCSFAKSVIDKKPEFRDVLQES
jgi:predicted GNAT family acetyltransferase